MRMRRGTTLLTAMATMATFSVATAAPAAAAAVDCMRYLSEKACNLLEAPDVRDLVDIDDQPDVVDIVMTHIGYVLDQIDHVELPDTNKLEKTIKDHVGLIIDAVENLDVPDPMDHVPTILAVLDQVEETIDDIETPDPGRYQEQIIDVVQSLEDDIDDLPDPDPSPYLDALQELLEFAGQVVEDADEDVWDLQDQIVQMGQDLINGGIPALPAPGLLTPGDPCPEPHGWQTYDEQGPSNESAWFVTSSYPRGAFVYTAEAKDRYGRTERQHKCARYNNGSSEPQNRQYEYRYRDLNHQERRGRNCARPVWDPDNKSCRQYTDWRVIGTVCTVSNGPGTAPTTQEYDCADHLI